MAGLEKENTSLKRTLSYISHELLNVLTLVDYSVKAVDGSVNQVRDNRYWQYIIDDVDYMVNVLRELSSYNHCGELKREECCIASWVKKAADEMRSKYGDRADIVVCAEGSDEQLTARVDKNKLRQVIINLIKNAVEATDEERKGHIWIFLRREEKRISIEVADDGCGISEENQRQIFEEGISINKKDGSGLGLAITKKIIETHDGTITVKSAEGEGTIFTIRLPV